MTDPAPLQLQPTSAEPAPAAAGSLFFIGNATVLLRFGGFTVLTDPSFIHMHEETWLGYGLHTTRLTDPACEIADLPPLDFVLLSHFHGDHFDQAAEDNLDRSLPIVTTPQSAELLAGRGFANTWPIDRWQTQVITKGRAELRITAMPGHHGPPLVDAALPDVMSSLLEFSPSGGAPGFRVYITGDTLLIDDLDEIPRRYPEIDLALLHLGGTRVLGILVSMDAEQGVTCLQLVNPRRAVPIHFDDYDVFKSPLSDFQEAVAAAGWADRVSYLDRGDTLNLSRGEAATVTAGLGPRGTSAESG
ncbi:MAG: MBL fold metallo-hydrolase [Chloroflexia bacterium]|nr:MBL fold metallo-hydrolase [Chloroflexia bacterium]